MEKNDIQDDPADWEKPEGGPQQSGPDRQPNGHREDQDRDANRDQERNDRSDWSFHFIGADQREQRHDWKRSGKRRQSRVIERIINLYLAGRGCLFV